MEQYLDTLYGAAVGVFLGFLYGYLVGYARALEYARKKINEHWRV